MKKIVIAALAFIVLAAGGTYVWARSILASEAVRHAIATQLASSIGQPVHIGGIGATIWPRVTMTLTDVAIGEPARIRMGRLDIGTDFGALLSRRIEHATLRLANARIDLPLPAFSFGGTATPGAAASPPPVELVSVDEVLLTDVDLVSGRRTLHGDVDLAPDAKGVAIRRVSLRADNTALELTGRITDLAGPVGELSVKAGSLDMIELLAFVTDFSHGSGIATSTSPTTTSTAARPMNLVVSIEAERAHFGLLTLDGVTGRARITPTEVAIDPVRFGVFSGTYTGTMSLALADTPTFALGASLANIDMAAFTAFAGSPNAITGRLAGRMTVTGRGTTPDVVIASARGQGRVDISNGVVARLGLVRAIVLAGSMRADSTRAAGSATADESFTALGATLAIGGGAATTSDLRFTSKDLALTGAGRFGLDGRAVSLTTRAQLSDELSAQAGRDLVRYTQDNGRVTLPINVTGSLDTLSVRVDVADAAKRAIVNRANEEAGKAIRKGLGGLLNRGRTN